MIDAFVGGLLSSLAAAAVVGLYLAYVFRSPRFRLIVYSKTIESGDGSIFFDLHNKKSLMAYNTLDLFFQVYVPVALVQGNIEVELDTPAGWKSWNALHNLPDKDRFRVRGIDYIRINGQNQLNIFPNRITSTFRFNGNFSSKRGTYLVYFSLDTRYGRFPKLRRFKFDLVDLQPAAAGRLYNVKGRLPYTMVQVR
jgi:hypothetical protein